MDYIPVNQVYRAVMSIFLPCYILVLIHIIKLVSLIKRAIKKVLKILGLYKFNVVLCDRKNTSGEI